MIEAGILVFGDSESLHVGKRIGDELLRAIESSKIYIPIFSKNYASSHWCLRELGHMVECTSKSNGNKEILPIFLDVEPDDVKLKTNLYNKALSKHRKKFYTEVGSWKKALFEVDGIKGWNWKKDESQVDVVQSVIQTVLAKLNVGFKKNVTEDLVGVDARVEAMIEMLHVESDNVRFLGIHGMGGIGKTTLAKVMFNQLSSHFEGCNFLSDIGETSRRHGMVHLQKKLLSKFPDARSILDQIDDVDDGTNMIKRVLSKKKVLIVLDDVDEKEQLKGLAGKGNWFGSGSRIIITTRDQSVLMIEGEATGEGLVEKSTKISTYEVGEMKFSHALNLFSRHAFRRESPPSHYLSLSTEVVSTLGNLPLAVEITGSSLNGKSEAFWEDTLKKLKEAPPKEVQRKLMVTFERLDHAQRQVFLDIACFFVNRDKTYPFYMWDNCGYCPHNAIEVLFLMSLVKIRDNNTFWMHDQVQHLGREIVRQENLKDPRERSRVWNCEEALSILKSKEAAKKLKVLNLNHCDNLRRTPEFSTLVSLEILILCGCSELIEIDPSIGKLKLLIALNLDGCTSLQELPEEIGCLQALTKIDLPNTLHELPEIFGNLKSLLTFDVPNRRISKLPYSIGGLVKIRQLDLSNCAQIKELPDSVGKLQSLVELDLSGTSIDHLPDSIGNLKQLKLLRMSNSGITNIPTAIGLVEKLEELDAHDCSKLIEIDPSIGKLKLLIALNLGGCTSLQELPEEIGCLQALTKIVLPNTLHELPEIFGNLKSLLTFDVPNRQISKLPYSIGGLVKIRRLDLSNCEQIKELPDSIGKLQSLVELNLLGTSIDHLPDSIGNLKQLKLLKLSCERVKFLPQLPSSVRELELRNLTTTQSLDFSNLKSLSTLEFYSCSLSEFSGIHDAELEVLHMRRCSFGKLDPLFQLEMKRLTTLKILWCEFFLPKVLDLSRMKNMQRLDLYGCKLLVEIRGLEELGSLCSLEVVACKSMERMLDLSKLRKLRKLRIGKCPKLRSVEGLNHLKSLKGLWIHDCCSLESLADTSNLDLEFSTVYGCEQLSEQLNNQDSYGRCNHAYDMFHGINALCPES
ncbi:disease resistance protein RUN1-like [Rhodamnia argentea]|uniref:Disease resistance protein RUN1-like n=1 Tax=Rhodamnia argentea TaxID=178133 RepID=A0ABM3HJ55_9MYRT|nr:disease resistance protein RUN1-like [Rhodamnia argentea]